MPSYTDLISRLGYSDEIVAIARGDVEMPRYSFDAPSHPLWCYFPPALLPLWSRSEGPCYIGIVKHWFGQDDGTFLEYDAEHDEIREIAKDFEQFKAWQVFDFLYTCSDAAEVGR